MKFVPEKNSPEWGLAYSINYLVTKMRLSTLQGLRAANFNELTLEQYEVLFMAFQNNGVYQSQLAKITLKDRANISRILKHLESKKYVLRKACPENKKIQKVYVTELGKQLVYLVAPVKNIKGEEFLKDFDEEELHMLTQLINKMHSNLEGMYTIST